MTFTIVSANEIRKLACVPRISGEEYIVKKAEFIEKETVFHLAEIELFLRDLVTSRSGLRIFDRSPFSNERYEIYGTDYIVNTILFTRKARVFFHGFDLCNVSEIYHIVCDNIANTLRSVKYNVRQRETETGYAVAIEWKTSTFGNRRHYPYSGDQLGSN